MQQPDTSFMEWMTTYQDESACLDAVARMRWPNGFQCPKCGATHAYVISTRSVYECQQCRHQTSVTAGTLFHKTHLPLRTWFTALYFVTSDKGGISALRLAKLIDVQWRTARNLLAKLRHAMGHQDSLYRLSQVIELDDAFIGGKAKGARGRGALKKAKVYVGIEVRHGKPGFVAIRTTPELRQANTLHFAQHAVKPGTEIRTDAYAGLRGLNEQFEHIAKATPKECVDDWLPWVHRVIGLLKRFLLGTFHGVSVKYLQEYINEFTYRFNRRYWERQLPNRALQMAVNHTPIQLA